MMISNHKELLKGILDSSEFLAATRPFLQKRSPSRLFGATVRHLRKEEIAVLEDRGNSCRDWNGVFVTRGFDPSSISESMFFGSCVLGACNGMPTAVDESISLPCGIYKSIIIDSEIGNNALVYQSTVSRYVVGESAVVFLTQTLSCTRLSSFGNGTVLPVGIETGGREITAFADLTIPIAQAVAFGRNRPYFQNSFSAFLRNYIAKCTFDVGVLGAHGVIRRTTKVRNSFLSSGSVVDGATLVDNSTVLCSKMEPSLISDGAMVSNSCLQWGCSVTSMAIVESSVLIDHSAVERHAQVTHSILGPNTHVAEGEVTASLVGPFVGFHHQSMLIGVMWPDGKGNVASGANIGSNHTSRAPDQELLCGEGIFFGLGANVKYPANFMGAPYSVIATGVTTAPQALDFPFSLIKDPECRPNDVSLGLNELVPAWVLSENLYAVLRNVAKFASRNKATHSSLELRVFRPEIIDLLIDARNRLAGVRKTRSWYDRSHIAGVGKNYLLEPSRRTAIDTYAFFVEYYCLRGLLARCEGLSATKGIYSRVTKDAQWEHQRSVLIKEGFSKRGLAENLMRLIAMQDIVARKTSSAKGKDDDRGRRIINDYDFTHTPAIRDAFVLETNAATRRIKSNIRKIISRL
jgi:hypothetical protein